METELKKAFTWEIDNFSERISDPSQAVDANGMLLSVPRYSDHLSVYLSVWNPKSLRLGWKRRAKFDFVLLNQSGKELYRSASKELDYLPCVGCIYKTCDVYCAEALNWGFPKTVPLTKLQEEGFLENNKLTIEVYIKLVKVVHEGKSTETDMVVINGFHVLNTQFQAVNSIFVEHPDIAVDIRPKNQVLKTAYMNVLLGLIETLNRPPESLSEIELSNAHSELSELTEAGFKLEWLKSKLEEVSLEREKANSDDSQLKKLEERIKYVELTLLDLKDELEKEKIKSATVADQVYSFEFIDFFIKRLFLSCFSISKH